jgi:hypothetical protein
MVTEHRGEDPSFLDTGLDFSEETFGAEEKAAMLAWYGDVHDHGDLDLAPFARFWIESDPGGFKRLKRHLLALEEPAGPASLPVAAGVLMWVHTYTATGNGKGAFYEIIACRKLGLSKGEISEAVRLGALAGGPSGMNPLGELAYDYFREWQPDTSAVTSPWPSGWSPDPDAFRSGIDSTTDDLSPRERRLVQDWYLRTHGEVPPHIDLLGRVRPRAYKTQRLRFEMAIVGALPAQLVPLMMLHLAVVRQTPLAIRRAAQLARGLGVERHHVFDTLFWAAVQGGDTALEGAVSAIADVVGEPEKRAGHARLPDAEVTR